MWGRRHDTSETENNSISRERPSYLLCQCIDFSSRLLLFSIKFKDLVISMLIYPDCIKCMLHGKIYGNIFLEL